MLRGVRAIVSVAIALGPGPSLGPSPSRSSGPEPSPNPSPNPGPSPSSSPSPSPSPLIRRELSADEMREMHSSQTRDRGPIHFVGPFRIHHGHATVRLIQTLPLALTLARTLARTQTQTQPGAARDVCARAAERV